MKKDLMINNLFLLNLKDMEVPQGICKINDLVLVTCYRVNNKSCVIIYKDGIRVNEIILPNKSHVGGVAYYKKLDLIFISDSKGYVSSYNFSEFIKGDLRSRNRIKINDRASSYLTVYKNKLYVGCFNKFKRGIVSVFDLEKNILKYEFTVPNKIQGVAFYNKGDSEYMLLSKSFGRKQNSKLLLYLYNKKKRRYIFFKKTIKLSPMLEQITFDNNILMLLFESSSCMYRDTCSKVEDSVLTLDINKFI